MASAARKAAVKKGEPKLPKYAYRMMDQKKPSGLVS